MEKEKNGHAKNLMVSLISIFALIVAAICTSYAAFTFSKAGDRVNFVTTGAIVFSYNETSNGISIVNAQPMTDVAGKAMIAQSTDNGINQGYFDFNITGSIKGKKTVSYEIYSLIDSSSTLDSQYVKVYLTDGALTDTPIEGFNGVSVPTYKSLPSASSDANGKRLYLGNFTQDDSVKNFRLRMWVADTYQGTTQTINPSTGITEVGTDTETFSVTINVKSL